MPYFPHIDVVPGGIAVIPLKVKSDTPPQVYFDNQNVMVVRSEDNLTWMGVLGIDLNQKPGVYLVNIDTNGKETVQNFQVTSKDYPQDVSRSFKYSDLIAYLKDYFKDRQDQKSLKPYLQKHSNTLDVNMKFQLPMRGKIISTVGNKWFFQQGLLITADSSDEKVFSAGTGTVLAIFSLPLRGKTILIDHGQGLITMYSNLNKIKVAPGQKVTAKTIIGSGKKIGMEVILNTVLVNPLLLIR